MKKTTTKSLNPSNYIITSYDLSKALGWKHDRLVESIKGYFKRAMLLERGFIHSYSAVIDRKHTTAYLFDHEAIIELGDAMAYDEGTNLPNAREVLLEIFFDLASKGTSKRSEFYEFTARMLSYEVQSKQRFIRRLSECAGIEPEPQL